MTNKTVTMPLELAERWARMAEVFDDGGDGADPETARTMAQEIRQVIAAPVAERQEPVPMYPRCTILKECNARSSASTECKALPPAPVAVVLDDVEWIRKAARKWFYESFDDDLLEKMQAAKLIAQAEGFSISVMAELELAMEEAYRNACLDKVKELNQ